MKFFLVNQPRPETAGSKMSLIQGLLKFTAVVGIGFYLGAAANQNYPQDIPKMKSPTELWDWMRNYMDGVKKLMWLQAHTRPKQQLFSRSMALGSLAVNNERTSTGSGPKSWAENYEIMILLAIFLWVNFGYLYTSHSCHDKHLEIKHILYLNLSVSLRISCRYNKVSNIHLPWSCRNSRSGEWEWQLSEQKFVCSGRYRLNTAWPFPVTSMCMWYLHWEMCLPLGLMTFRHIFDKRHLSIRAALISSMT